MTTGLAGTVELGGMADTQPEVASASCEAILAFLSESDYIARGGGVGGCDFPPLPAPTCDPTPLAGVHEIMPPHAGVWLMFAHICSWFLVWISRDARERVAAHIFERSSELHGGNRHDCAQGTTSVPNL